MPSFALVSDLLCGLPLVSRSSSIGAARWLTRAPAADRCIAGRRRRAGRNNPRELSPTSQLHVGGVAILETPDRGWREPMRAYLTVIGLALGLVAVWAALVPFVA
jgi:hypothetical protein